MTDSPVQALNNCVHARRHEDDSEAHKLYRSGQSLLNSPSPDLAPSPSGGRVPGHGHHSTPSSTKAHTPHKVPGIDAPGETGVMYVSSRAAANGWQAGSSEWANFGQGAPEVGHIPSSSPRPSTIDIAALSEQLGADVNEYAPTTGLKKLREAVAKLYNETYREGKESQYTYENVCIVPGGRAGLTRIASVLSDIYVAYSIPEYTAYDQLLSAFKRLVPLPTTLREEDSYHLNVNELERMVREMGVTGVMLSNPHNPTGQVIYGDDLKKLVDISRNEGVTMILDEFYEQYIYDLGPGAQVSAAEFVQDVNEDNVILINGLTKCWRLPGWRVCWVIGPKELVKALGQSGGFLDGGASHLLQAASIPLLDPQTVKSDRHALQTHFREKRDHVLKRLRAMGFEVKNAPTSTFYCWLDLRGLPAPLDSGLVFFEELLKEKVIVVPGQFFDLNPSHRRNLMDSPCDKFIRVSFGPPLEELDRGLDGFERLLARVKKHVEKGEDLQAVIGRDLKQ
ncbi:hypothetical protein JCM11251_005548 [Rhodosporidiobolus azoricus]